MIVKTYRGKSPEECFRKMRVEMGRDAVILQSRTYSPILGRFGAKRHEVVAASDISIAIDKIAGAARAASEAQQEPSRSVYGYAATAVKARAEGERAGRSADTLIERRQPAEAGVLSRSTGRSQQFSDDPDPRINQLEKQIALLSATLESLQGPPAVQGRNSEEQPAQAQDTRYTFLLEKLLDAEVAEPLAKRLIADLPVGLSDAAAPSELRGIIARRLKIAGGLEPVPGRTRVVAFIGGTGVGKTTTIAKIAAHLSLAQRLNVAIVTMDTHRVAAVQQLQTYGEILRVPVKVAYNKGEFAQHVASFRKERKDFVLLDTAGRSPHDTLPLAEVAASLEGLEDICRILTLPATLSARDFENMVTRFQSVLSPDAMIVTKVDEASDNSYLGHLLSVQAKTGLPIAYLTSGQRVPDDMLTPDAHALATRLLSTAVI
ncbi:MAG TPA: flagellar biosynthesis protein FlhF [Capsulimonadaceae bacterium]|nr:flagellar biosynthesis protein FlhF [Capsulimonadaceae bacterium]